MLVTETGVKERKIEDERVMEDISIVTVPYLYADHILQAIKSRKVKGKSLISKAKMDRGSSSAQGKRGFARRKR